MKPVSECLQSRFNLFSLGFWLLLSGMLTLSGCAPTGAAVATFTADPEPAQTGATVTLAQAAEPGMAVPAETLPPPTPSPTAEPTIGEPETMTIEPGLEPLIEQAVADLAQRLDIAIETIQVLSAESVVWPDASLGCPQPGMAYPQVLQDGALIRLQAEGVVFEYHSGGARGVFLCEKVSKDLEPHPQIDITKHIPPPRD